METIYLELVEGVGVEPPFTRDPKTGLEIPNDKAGEPQPLTHIGIQIPVPTMVGKDVIDTTAKAYIEQARAIDPKDPVQSRIIPGTRIVETTAPAVVNLLLETGHYQQVAAPTSEQPHRPRQGRKAHASGHGEHTTHDTGAASTAQED